MRYARSLLLGSSLVIIIIILSVLIFYYSLGQCAQGSFACGNQCLVQHQFCDGFEDCEDGTDENRELCGELAGSKKNTFKYLHHMYFRGNKSEDDILNKCDIPEESIPKKCFCESGNRIGCITVGLTKLPRIRGVSKLILTNNNITLEGENTTDDVYTTLHTLTLAGNKIERIPSGMFSMMPELAKLTLTGNRLSEITPDSLKGLNNLAWLIADQNQLTRLILPSGMIDLDWLDVSHNKLTFDDPAENFPEMPKLLDMYLQNNRITHIRKDLFAQVSSLHMLRLEHNRISTIEEGAFDNLTNLIELNLSYNGLHNLPPELFSPLQDLDKLQLNFNPLEINEDVLPKSITLRFLELDGIERECLDFTLLEKLKNLIFIKLYKFHYCSMLPKMKCVPNTDGVSNQADLLSRPTLRFSAWIVAILTLLLNLLVLWGRGTSRDENRALSILIRNLAVADMLMGIYLLVIAMQDTFYRGEYFQHSRTWTNSGLCITIGAVAMISLEVSMLILAFMSVERFLLIVNPLGGYTRLSLKSVKRALITIWVSGLTLALLPIVYWRNSTQFYGTYSGTCFPLHLRQQYPIGWQYSAFIFLGINLTGLLVIASVYCCMFISVWRTQRAAPSLSADCEFAIRFFFIVLTDAVCWAPIICLKILNFFSIEISNEVYAWLVVFILPLNSAVNPLLYTFTTPKYRDRLLSFNWKFSTNRSTNEDTEVSKTSSNKNIMCTVLGNIKNNGDYIKPQITSCEPITMFNSFSSDCKL